VGKGGSTRFTQFELVPRSPGVSVGLLRTVGHRRCTDPRDRVYGLLGLLEPEVRRQIQVRYDKPAALVYAEAIKAILVYGETVGHVSGVHLSYIVLILWEEMYNVPHGVGGLQSWCPDLINVSQADWYETAALWQILPRGLSYDCDQTFNSVPGSNVISLKVRTVGVVDCCAAVPCPGEAEKCADSDYRHRFDMDAIRIWLSNLRSTFPRHNADHQVIGFSNILEAHFFDNPDFTKLPEASSSLDEPWNLFNDIPFPSARSGEEMSLQSTESTEEKDKYATFFAMSTGSRRGWYTFRPASGLIGCAIRPLMPGARLCFVPQSEHLHVLSPTSTRYISAVRVPEMDGLLQGILDGEAEKLWEVVYFE